MEAVAVGPRSGKKVRWWKDGEACCGVEGGGATTVVEGGVAIAAAETATGGGWWRAATVSTEVRISFLDVGVVVKTIRQRNPGFNIWDNSVNGIEC
nr:hypothetical protein Iba_chr03aCG16290 [Ipomoea batatas]